MKTYKITYKELDRETKKVKNVEVIVEANYKEHAREKFKQEIGIVPLNYRIKEVK